MDVVRLSYSIFIWIYTQGLVDLLRIWKNFLALIYRVFSFPDLIKTFFSPWRRLKEPYSNGPGVDFEQIAGALVANTMMRIVGAFVRTIFLALGLIFLIITAVVGVLVFCVWILMPFVFVGSLALGIGLLST